MNNLIVGTISFDFTGSALLVSFSGTYKVPDVVMRNTRDAIILEGRYDEIRGTELAGCLARSIVDGDCVRDISYFIRGSEYPRREVV